MRVYGFVVTPRLTLTESELNTFCSAETSQNNRALGPFVAGFPRFVLFGFLLTQATIGPNIK